MGARMSSSFSKILIVNRGGRAAGAGERSYAQHVSEHQIAWLAQRAAIEPRSSHV